MPTFPIIPPGSGARFTFGRPSPTRISTASLETIRVAVSASLSGAVVDPSEDDITFAFTTGATPVLGDFVAGSWEIVGTDYFATCLVGTGGSKVLAAGLYAVWVKVTDNPEVPVRRVGDLGVF